MSIVNVLLGQKSILLTLGAAVLLLLAAIVLSVLPRIRAWLKAYRHELSLRQLAREREATVSHESAILAAEAETQQMTTTSIKQAEPSVSGTSGVKDAKPPQPAPTVAAAQTPAPSVESAPATPGDTKSASAIQDILSSVFGNEESLARYEVLFHDVEPISAVDLLALATRVIGQLKAIEAPLPGTKDR